MNIRPAGPEDRAWISALLGGTSAIDAPGNHIIFAEDLPANARVFAVWHSPPDGGAATLGAVMSVGPERRDLFYGAILAAAESAIAAGHTKAGFRILDRRVVSRIKRDFQEDPTPIGRNVKTGKPGHWELTVNLASAAEKLHAVL